MDFAPGLRECQAHGSEATDQAHKPRLGELTVLVLGLYEKEVSLRHALSRAAVSISTLWWETGKTPSLPCLLLRVGAAFRVLVTGLFRESPQLTVASLAFRSPYFDGHGAQPGRITLFITGATCTKPL